MVLSSSVSSPMVTSSIFLPRSRARSWTRRRKRPNSEPIGTMRTPIVVSRSSSDEPLDFLGDRLDRGVVAGRRDLGQAGLRDHQLADPVHQFVEPLGRHADAVGGLGCRARRLPAMLLLGDAEPACPVASPVTGRLPRRRCDRDGWVADDAESRRRRSSGAVCASPCRSGSISSSMSSMTNRNTSSIAARGWSVGSVTSQRR